MTEPTAPVPGDPIALLAALADGLRTAGATFASSPDGTGIVIISDTETPILVSAVENGMVSAFAPLIDGAASPEDQAEAVALLTARAPIPAEWESLAAYRPGDAGEVGLAIALPMPRRASMALLADAVDLVAETANRLAS